MLNKSDVNENDCSERWSRFTQNVWKTLATMKAVMAGLKVQLIDFCSYL